MTLHRLTGRCSASVALYDTAQSFQSIPSYRLKKYIKGEAGALQAGLSSLTMH